MRTLTDAELSLVGTNILTPSAMQLRSRLEDALDRAEMIARMRKDALEEAAEEYGRALAAALRARDELIAKFPEAK